MSASGGHVTKGGVICEDGLAKECFTTCQTQTLTDTHRPPPAPNLDV